MKIVILGSGSKGNATYIETNEGKFLIDCGLTYLQIKNRLKNKGIVLNKLDGIFITHEHTDHVRALHSVLELTGATLYMNKNSFYEAEKKLRAPLSQYPHCFVEADSRYCIADLDVVPIQLYHDSVNCYGYLLKQRNTTCNESFAAVTDTGLLPDKYYKILGSIKVLLIESNHDVEMLMNSGRPQFLINRILSENGHLSNEQCVFALKNFITEKNKEIYLAHISEDCNEYELAEEVCRKALTDKKVNINVAYQYEESNIIDLGEIND